MIEGETAPRYREFEASLRARDSRWGVRELRDVELEAVIPQARQDSSMLAILERSDARLVREPYAPAAKAGEPCRIIRLARFC